MILLCRVEAMLISRSDFIRYACSKQRTSRAWKCILKSKLTNSCNDNPLKILEFVVRQSKLQAYSERQNKMNRVFELHEIPGTFYAQFPSNAF